MRAGEGSADAVQNSESGVKNGSSVMDVGVAPTAAGVMRTKPTVYTVRWVCKVRRHRRPTYSSRDSFIEEDLRQSSTVK